MALFIVNGLMIDDKIEESMENDKDEMDVERFDISKDTIGAKYL